MGITANDQEGVKKGSPGLHIPVPYFSGNARGSMHCTVMPQNDQTMLVYSNVPVLLDTGIFHVTYNALLFPIFILHIYIAYSLNDDAMTQNLRQYVHRKCCNSNYIITYWTLSTELPAMIYSQKVITNLTPHTQLRCWVGLHVYTGGYINRQGWLFRESDKVLKKKRKDICLPFSDRPKILEN